MMFNTTMLAGVAAVCVGFAAFWANPRRALNRVFFSGSLHAALWVICRTLATESGPHQQEWLRIAMSIGALLPFHLWVIKETIVSGVKDPLEVILARGKWWVFCCLGLAAITFTQWFVPIPTQIELPPFGQGYYVHIGGLLVLYALLCRETLVQMRSQSGVGRLELQIVLLGGSAAAVTVIALMGARAVFELDLLTQLRPMVVFVFFALTAIAITNNRILDARHIVYVGVKKVALVGAVAVVAASAYWLLASWLPLSASFLATVAVGLGTAAWLSDALDRLLSFYPQALVARQAAHSVAQREARVENLEKAFRAVLCGWGQADHALIMSGAKSVGSASGTELADDSPVLKSMQQLRWATPERLARERWSADRAAVSEFMTRHELGVLVVEGGPALTVLVGVGVAASRRPFTYPQVTQLTELASIMESALERAHFSQKVQHAEQLATVGLLGASLAHEIRNPLVSIKTFVQLLPTHHHDPKFRDKFFNLIGDEVGRIDRLTEQLLDLASPRVFEAEVIELHPLLRSSLDLVATKAAHRNVEFLTEFRAFPDRAFTDASAAKQVMLNLCFNAIQAVEHYSGDQRWVKIATRNTAGGIEMTVADSGPGIAAEIRPHLFQPFQTTKSTGFGLGLAICSDILSNLHASISVDPPMPGQGATFRVTFPCQPLSS